MPKVLIIITGPVCAGKTELAKVLAKELNAPTVFTEDFHVRYLPRLEKNLSSAFEDFLQVVEQKLSSNEAVIAEGLFLKGERRSRLWHLATKANAQMAVVTLRIDRPTLERRYRGRRLLGYESLGIEHALKLREEFLQKPWGRVIDATKLSVKSVAKLVRSDCQRLRAAPGSAFRVYFDNTTLGAFFGLQETGLVPQWGTTQCLDLCQALDGLVCAGSVVYLRFPNDAIYRDTEERIQAFVSRDARFGNLFAPFALEIRTLQGMSEAALMATVEHFRRCTEKRELEASLTSILAAGGPHVLSRHGNKISQRMREIGKGRLRSSSKNATELAAVAWFERALGESRQSYSELQRSQTGLAFSMEEYWTAVHRLFRCFLHSALGREGGAPFWSTARRGAIIRLGVQHPLAKFRTMAFENTLLEKWQDKEGRLFGLTGLFCELPLFGACLLGRVSAASWDSSRFNDEFWDLRTAPDVVELRKHLEDFSKHLQAGPDGLDESRRTLNAIEKLGTSVAKQLRVRSGRRQVHGRRRSLAVISARRLQWLALWIHGAESSPTGGQTPIVSAFADTTPKLEFLENTPPRVRVNGKVLSLPSNRCYALLLLLAERHTCDKPAAVRQADLLNPFVRTLNSLPDRFNLRLEGRDENFRDRRCIPAMKTASSGTPGKPDTAIASVLTQLREHLNKTVRSSSDEGERSAATILLQCVPARKKPFQLLRLTSADVTPPPPAS